MISSVGSNSGLQTIASILQSIESSSSSSSGATNSTSSDSTSLSGPAQLYSELQQLASSDPTAFKQVAAEIAQQLEAAAGESSSGGTSSTDGTSSLSSTSSAGGANQMLANLASKFEQAAETGNVSVLQPASGPLGGGQSNGIGMYNQQGQMAPPPPDSSNTGGVDMQSLFNSINQEVTNALNNLNSTSSTT